MACSVRHFGLVVPPALCVMGWNMRREAMLFVALGRGLQKLPPLTLKRPLGGHGGWPARPAVTSQIMQLVMALA